MNLTLSLLTLEFGARTPIVLAQDPGTFSATGSMTTARSGHTATLLPDGRALIAGGGSTAVELFDPATGTSSAIGSRTAFGNVGSATLLPDRRVLLLEQATVQLPNGGILRSTIQTAELYDPSTGTLTATGSMIEAQIGYAATLLLNGKVLITGGTNMDSDCCPQVASPELYDPSTQTFSLAGAYTDTGDFSSWAGSEGLVFTTATLLPGGKILISSESSAELYDPATDSFSLTGSMTAPYFFLGGKPTTIPGRAATLLANGKVLLTGGEGGYEDTGDVHPLASAEFYDSYTGTFTATGDMTMFRRWHAATTLPDGTVLITGGIVDNFLGTSPTAELYNPATGVFAVAGNLETGRFGHQATLLNDGRVLITGGCFSTSPQDAPQALASAEIYTPAVLVQAPVLFSLSGDGGGQGAIWQVQTGQIASSQNPAVAGEILAMYTTSLFEGGAIAPQVAVGGRLAEILFFGAAPGYPGYYQVNFRVPIGIPPGSGVPVRLTYLGRPSNQVGIVVQ